MFTSFATHQSLQLGRTTHLHFARPSWLRTRWFFHPWDLTEIIIRNMCVLGHFVFVTNPVRVCGCCHSWWCWCSYRACLGSRGQGGAAARCGIGIIYYFHKNLIILFRWYLISCWKFQLRGNVGEGGDPNEVGAVLVETTQVSVLGYSFFSTRFTKSIFCVFKYFTQKCSKIFTPAARFFFFVRILCFIHCCALFFLFSCFVFLNQ